MNMLVMQDHHWPLDVALSLALTTVLGAISTYEAVKLCTATARRELNSGTSHETCKPGA